VPGACSAGYRLSMADTWIGSQIVLRSEGGSVDCNLPRTMRESISRAAGSGSLNALMIWADAPPVETSRIIRICRDYGVQVYLWLPVLADTYGYEIREEELVVTAEGQRGNGWIGRWGLLGSNAEEFLFVCPNNDAAVQRIFSAYRSLMDDLDLDGVMLDRIRYPSFVNGFETLYTCFCDHCRGKFIAETGRDFDRLRIVVREFISSLSSWRTGNLPHWEDLEAFYQSSELQELARFRKKSIQRVVERYSKYARNRGLSVGLDLFSPSLAGTVGQDYGSLSRCCDWIKPMSYCHAVGPAGLPLELSCLNDALSALCTDLREIDTLKFLGTTLGWDLPLSSEQLLKSGVPESIVAGELDRIQDLLGSEGAHIYPGVEAVRHPGFGIDIRIETLDRYLENLPNWISGVIASWNLLYIPDENLRHLSQRMRRRS
jgi:hypothetical protein